MLCAVVEPVGPPEPLLSPPLNLLPRWIQDAAEAVLAAESILPEPTWSAGLQMVESEPESYLSGYEDYLAQNQADVLASSTQSLDETLVTCEQCGHRWDGNAQCDCGLLMQDDSDARTHISISSDGSPRVIVEELIGSVGISGPADAWGISPPWQLLADQIAEHHTRLLRIEARYDGMNR